MWTMGGESNPDGNVEGLARLLDEGVDPLAPEECDPGVSRGLCVLSLMISASGR
jgi:hypothetical protein